MKSRIEEMAKDLEAEKSEASKAIASLKVGREEHLQAEELLRQEVAVLKKRSWRWEGRR